MNTPDKPSGEDCNNGRTWTDSVGRRYLACWYPAMGGYVARCVVVSEPGEEESCFDAYVWHDGEFPFGEGSREARAKLRPVELHHCNPSQFIEFGKAVLAIQGNVVEDPANARQR